MSSVTLPDYLPYLLLILGVLLVWEIYDIQVRKGRLKAIGFINRSGFRFFLHITPEDSATCPTCREASGMAYLPSIVAAGKYRPVAKTCTNPAGCRCVIVGLYGAWPQAERVRAGLKKSAGRGRLSTDQIEALLEGARAGRAGATVIDRLALCLLEATRTETSDPQSAMERYRLLLDQADDDRDQALVVPSYLRLSELLEGGGRKADALRVVEQFFKIYGDKRQRPHGPSEAQFEAINLRRTRLRRIVVG
ncbi:MAG: hypothetical protein ACREIS_00715 [Nitrospiraceae bacterium]